MKQVSDFKDSQTAGHETKSLTASLPNGRSYIIEAKADKLGSVVKVSRVGWPHLIYRPPVLISATAAIEKGQFEEAASLFKRAGYTVKLNGF